MAATNTISYGDCVNSLRDSLSHLEQSVDTLDSGVKDFPRLVVALKQVRVWWTQLFLRRPSSIVP